MTPSATKSPAAKDVEAVLNYMVDDGITPWVYNRPTTRQDPHKTRVGGNYDPIRLVVQDARQHPELSLDQHAFQYVSQTTSLSPEDFYRNPNQKIQNVYYKEMQALIAKQMGAAQVVVLKHQVRNESKNGADGAAHYARGIHCDYSASWGETTYSDALNSLPPSERDQCSKGRFVVINAWRNISNAPIEQDNLAVCDETSLVKPDDYIPSEYRDYTNAGKQLRLASRHASQHRWYYLPNMTRDEVLLFKQHDSDTTLSGRSCFHTAFHDPTARSDAPPRESIEVRAVAFFPNHEPNTCPDRNPIAPIKAADRVQFALETVMFWPLPLKWFFRYTVGKSDGVSQLIDFLLSDPRNNWNLHHITDDTRSATKAMLLKDVTFAQHARATKAKLEGVAAAGRKRSPWTWWIFPSNW